jgi:hypothetical protein
MADWHSLSQVPFGNEYNQALARLTSEVTTSTPKETWRVRTNEGVLDDTWELREFALSRSSSPTGAPRLVQQPIATTPRIELDGSPSLESWVTDNETRILAGTYVLPGGFQAGAATLASSTFRWSPSSTKPVMTALSRATCNGCHGGERNESSLPFQHIAAPDAPTKGYVLPSSDGETRVSEWLSSSSGDDELGRRARSMTRALCMTCRGRY